jgi:hypothetical protein
VNIGTLYRCLFSAVDVDEDDARARAVRKSDSKYKDTHTPPERVACPLAETVHAWCAGRVHVPTGLHLEFLAKMGRLPHETDAVQEARLIAFYATTCAALPPEQPISDNDYTFWRRAFAAAWARDPTTRGQRRDDTGVTRFTRQELEDAKLIRMRAYGGCPHEPKCATYADCVREIALARKVG